MSSCVVLALPALLRSGLRSTPKMRLALRPNSLHDCSLWLDTRNSVYLIVLGLIEHLISDENVTPYAIVSHTWQEGQEVTLDDLMSNSVCEVRPHGC